MARPTKLTPAITKKLLNFIRMGLPHKRAAECAGIGERTFYDWIRYAEEGKEGFSQFSQELKKAESEAQAKLIQDIQKDPSWQSKAWILERRWADEWGRKEKYEIDHKGKIEVEIDEDLKEELKFIRQKLNRKD